MDGVVQRLVLPCSGVQMHTCKLALKDSTEHRDWAEEKSPGRKQQSLPVQKECAPNSPREGKIDSDHCFLGPGSVEPSQPGHSLEKPFNCVVETQAAIFPKFSAWEGGVRAGRSENTFAVCVVGGSQFSASTFWWEFRVGE